jgi:hypothetical protein
MNLTGKAGLFDNNAEIFLGSMASKLGGPPFKLGGTSWSEAKGVACSGLRGGSGRSPGCVCGTAEPCHK